MGFSRGRMPQENDHMESTTEEELEIQRKLKIGIAADILFSAAQFVVGYLFGSLALISNGGHGLTDALSMVISFVAAKVSLRKATRHKTYGYGRTAIIAALINSVLLIIFAVFIFAEAYLRILNPAPVNGPIIIVMALIGIIISGGIAASLRKHNDNLNAKSVFLHMGYDAVALVGTLLAGFLIILTKQSIFDPIISIMIGVLMVVGAWSVMTDAFNILLEGVPKWIDTELVRETISSHQSVKSVHDLHIWAISSQYAALSCHIVVYAKNIAECSKVILNIKKELRERFRVDHATIEAELMHRHKKSAYKPWDT